MSRRREKKSVKRLLKEMSWQDRIFGVFLLAAALSLIILGMRMVGSNGVLILLGAMCFYFVTTIYRMNRDSEDGYVETGAAQSQPGLAENTMPKPSGDKRRELAENLVGKNTKDKHKDLMGDLMGKS